LWRGLGKAASPLHNPTKPTLFRLALEAQLALNCMLENDPQERIA
jgi:hypothetical protein